MPTVDVRHACVALIQQRVITRASRGAPAPLALGRQLERVDASLPAMASLCAGALADAAAPLRWRPAPVLRALLSEYGAVRREAGAPAARAADRLH